MSIGKILLDSVSGLRHKDEGGLVRMFEVEYNKEYRCAVRNGVTIDAQFVRNFLKTMR